MSFLVRDLKIRKVLGLNIKKSGTGCIDSHVIHTSDHCLEELSIREAASLRAIPDEDAVSIQDTQAWLEEGGKVDHGLVKLLVELVAVSS